MGSRSRSRSSEAIWTVLLAWAGMTIIGGGMTKAEGGNKSASGRLFWSTAKEEGDLVRKAEVEDSIEVFNQKDDFDGGFSSLDGMLQWSIGHSDPAKLKETAENVQRLSPDKLKKRQMELKELVERLKMPSDAQLMQIAIDDLNNSSLPSEYHHRALQELLILVEQIDNANGEYNFNNFCRAKMHFFTETVNAQFSRHLPHFV
ncbi:hypothetical protein CsSME_00021516 [Camellia sinensis var. sinensis]